MKQKHYASIAATIFLFLACLSLLGGSALLVYAYLMKLNHRILEGVAPWMEDSYLALISLSAALGLLSAIGGIAGRASRTKSTSFLSVFFPNLALLVLGGSMYAFLYLTHGLALPTMSIDLYMCFVEFGFLFAAVIGGLGVISSIVIAKRGHGSALIVFGVLETVLGIAVAAMLSLAYLHFRAAGVSAVDSCAFEDYGFLGIGAAAMLLGLTNLLIACKRKEKKEEAAPETEKASLEEEKAPEGQAAE